MAQPSALSSRVVGIPDIVTLGDIRGGPPLTVQARLLGSRIDTRDLAGDRAIAAHAEVAGLTIVFRFGVVVTIGAGNEPVASFDEALRPYVIDPTAVREHESARIELRPDGGDRIGPEGEIQLAALGHDRLLLVGIMLARSVLLARDEFLIGEAFDRIAPLVADLQENGRAQLSIRSAMRLVGNVLAARHRVTGTAQVDERPDLLWDHPELDRLYSRLEVEYELKERDEVLQRKLGALSDFTEALLDVVQDKRAFRVEIAIIALIAFEAALSLFNVLTR